jgi:hypothetical protein
VFAAQISGGIIGLREESGMWYGAVLMTVLMLAWTAVLRRLDGGRIDAGTAVVATSPVRLGLGIAVAIVPAVISLLILIWLVPGVRFDRGLAGGGKVAAEVALFVLLAAFEEIAFRGYPLRRLLPAFGVWPALLIIAPVFVAYHISIGWNPVLAMLGTSAGSMLFGMAAVAARRGLAFPIGVHAGWNFTTWALSGAGGGGIWKMTIPGGMTGRVQTMGMAGYLVCMSLATAGLWIWKRMKA